MKKRTQNIHFSMKFRTQNIHFSMKKHIPKVLCLTFGMHIILTRSLFYCY